MEGGNGHVRIVFQVKTLVHQYKQWGGGKCHVRIVFWRKYRHSEAYIKLMDTQLLYFLTHGYLLQTLLDFPNAYQCVYILLK